MQNQNEPQETEQKEESIIVAEDSSTMSTKFPTFTVSGGKSIEWIARLVREDYTVRVADKRKDINWHMKGLYNRVILFDEKDTTSVTISLCKLLSVTGEEKTCHIQDFINDYMGERVTFFRDCQKKRIPVEIDRIADAYLAAKSGKAKEEVHKILYQE